MWHHEFLRRKCVIWMFLRGYSEIPSPLEKETPIPSIFYSRSCTQLQYTILLYFSCSMARNNNSQEEPLLLSGSSRSANFSEKSPWLPSLAKWTLKFLMWVILIIWVCAIFFYCIGREVLQMWVTATQGTIFGITGIYVLIFLILISYFCFVNHVKEQIRMHSF